MKLIDSELAKAERNSAAARQELAQTIGALQRRMKPALLARDAADQVKKTAGELSRIGAERARRNPVAAAGLAAAAVAFFARKPLIRLFRRKPDPQERV